MNGMVANHVTIDQTFDRYIELGDTHPGLQWAHQKGSRDADTTIGNYNYRGCVWSFLVTNEADRQTVLAGCMDKSQLTFERMQGKAPFVAVLLERDPSHMTATYTQTTGDMLFQPQSLMPEFSPLAWYLHDILPQLESGRLPGVEFYPETPLGSIQHSHPELVTFLLKGLGLDQKRRYISNFATAEDLRAGKDGAFILRQLARSVYRYDRTELRPGIVLVKDPYTDIHRQWDTAVKETVKPPIDLIESELPDASNYVLFLHGAASTRLVAIDGALPLASELEVPDDKFVNRRTTIQPHNLLMTHLVGECAFLDNVRAKPYVQLLQDIQAAQSI